MPSVIQYNEFIFLLISDKTFIVLISNEVAMKRHKDPVNTSIENSDAQVFVLPPDILEKLGIQLNNIVCPPEGSKENSSKYFNCFHSNFVASG